MYYVKINELVWQYATAQEAWNNKPLQVRRSCPQMNLGGDVVTGVGGFDEFVRLLDSGKTLQYHALSVYKGDV